LSCVIDLRSNTPQTLIPLRPNLGVLQKRSSDSSKKLKGIQTLTPAKQEAADIMKALKESKKMSKRQPRTGGSNEGTGNILGVPDESTVISRVSSEGTGSKPGVPDEEKHMRLWKITCMNERVIDDKPESHSGSMSSMKNLDDTFNFRDQFLYDKPTKDDQEKSKVREESDSTIPDPSHQTVTSTLLQ
ncbi:hypothetical protein Tco_0160340, partial [Tanacetum coccineum]